MTLLDQAYFQTRSVAALPLKRMQSWTEVAGDLSSSWSVVALML